MAGALNNITVLDLSRLLPGPFCSMVLADHGAQVIAIEDKRYASEFGGTKTICRNKQHMTLNLKSEAGREIFYAMVKTADVVLEGFRPGVTARLGVDYETLSGINPKIVYCSISGYGQTGPLREKAGHDVNYLSTAGVLDLIGEKDGRPLIPGFQIADIAGGALYAVIGVVMALYSREMSGKGQYVDISMTDGAMSLLSLVLGFRQLMGAPIGRSDSILSHRYACYNTYETADGRYLSIGAVENRFWKIICEFFEVPGYIPHQYDDAMKDEIISFMRSKFKQKTLAQWEAALDGLDVCWGPVKTLDEALKDPLFAEREMVASVVDKAGKPLTVLGTPVKLSRTPGSIRTRPPEFGEHTAEILNEMGFSDEQIKDFEANGII